MTDKNETPKLPFPDKVFCRMNETRKNSGTWSAFSVPHTKHGPTDKVKGDHYRVEFIRVDTHDALKERVALLEGALKNIRTGCHPVFVINMIIDNALAAPNGKE